MGPVEVRILVDHLRFDPDSEVEAGFVDPPDHRRQTVGEFVRIDAPVAQSGPVVFAPFEPSVVDHEQLYADLFRNFCKVELLVLLDVERGGVPAVIEHGPDLIGR